MASACRACLFRPRVASMVWSEAKPWRLTTAEHSHVADETNNNLDKRERWTPCCLFLRRCERYGQLAKGVPNWVSKCVIIGGCITKGWRVCWYWKTCDCGEQAGVGTSGSAGGLQPERIEGCKWTKDRSGVSELVLHCTSRLTPPAYLVR